MAKNAVFLVAERNILWELGNKLGKFSKKSSNEDLQNILRYCKVREKVDPTFLPALHKNQNISLKISPVNVIKSTGNCGFGHIYKRNP